MALIVADQTVRAAGLGVHIVRQIVEAHGGEVSVASIEGVGTSMVLKLPVKRLPTVNSGAFTALSS